MHKIFLIVTCLFLFQPDSLSFGMGSKRPYPTYQEYGQYLDEIGAASNRISFRYRTADGSVSGGVRNFQVRRRLESEGMCVHIVELMATAARQEAVGWTDLKERYGIDGLQFTANLVDRGAGKNPNFPKGCEDCGRMVITNAPVEVRIFHTQFEVVPIIGGRARSDLKVKIDESEANCDQVVDRFGANLFGGHFYAFEKLIFDWQRAAGLPIGRNDGPIIDFYRQFLNAEDFAIMHYALEELNKTRDTPYGFNDVAAFYQSRLDYPEDDFEVDANGVCHPYPQYAAQMDLVDGTIIPNLKIPIGYLDSPRVLYPHEWRQFTLVDPCEKVRKWRAESAELLKQRKEAESARRRSGLGTSVDRVER